MRECPLKINDIAWQLAEKLEGSDLPPDYEPADDQYLQIIANIRHEYTNYEELLYALSAYTTGACPVYFISGEIHPDCEEEQCAQLDMAHDILKSEAKKIAVQLFDKWSRTREF